MQFRPSKHDRPTFGKLASQYNLTYYGTIIPDESNDYIPVRGMTASPEQVDDNYTVGTVADYHVQLLQRGHDVYLPDNRRAYRTWTICQVDLKQANLPHLIIGGKDKSTNDEATLASYLRMYEIDLSSLGSAIAPDFAAKFAVYVSPQDIATVCSLFTPELQAMLAVHFPDHDFEIDGRHLYVYSVHQPLTLNALDKQLRIGLWLAQQIDAQK